MIWSAWWASRMGINIPMFVLFTFQSCTQGFKCRPERPGNIFVYSLHFPPPWHYPLWMSESISLCNFVCLRLLCIPYCNFVWNVLPCSGFPVFLPPPAKKTGTTEQNIGNSTPPHPVFSCISPCISREYGIFLYFLYSCPQKNTGTHKKIQAPALLYFCIFPVFLLYFWKPPINKIQ